MLTRNQKGELRSELFRYLDGLGTSPVAYCLYSIAGVLVEEIQLVAFDQGTIELNVVGSIPAGIYFLKVEGRTFSHLGKVFVVR